MSSVYEICAEDKFECVNALDERDYEIFATLDGKPRITTWTPIRVRRVGVDGRVRLAPSDFPWLTGHAIVMRRTASVVLRDMLEANGELLPLVTDDDVDLVVFNSRVIDALDEANAIVDRIPGTRLVHIREAAFVPELIKDADVFQLPIRGGATYVSQRFVDRVEAAGLRGVFFSRVWTRSDF